MRPHTALSIAVGTATGLLFILLLMGAAQGVLTLLAPFSFFLPMIPLFGVGFLYGMRNLAYAGLASSLVALLSGNSDIVLIFAGATLAPVFLSHWLLTLSSQPRLMSVTEGLTWLAAALTLLVGLFLWSQEYGSLRGMEGLLRSNFEQDISTLAQDEGIDPAALTRLSSLSSLTFFIPAVMGWFWALLTLGHLTLAHRIAARFGTPTPPTLAFGNQEITPSFLGWLAIAALGSLIGSASFAFLCKALFIILLLPYFIVAMVRAHQKARNWPNGGFALTCLYGMLVCLVWPALVIAVVAAVRHGIRIASPTAKNT